MALWAWLETSNDVPGCSTGTLASAPGLRSDDEHPHRLVGPVRAVPSKSSRAWTNPRPCSRGQSGSGWQPHEHRSMSYPAWLAYPLMGPTADVEDPVACLQDGASLHLGTVSGVDPDRKNGAPGGIRISAVYDWCALVLCDWRKLVTAIVTAILPPLSVPPECSPPRGSGNPPA